jgi:GTP cyclohydrolase III
MKMFIYLDGDDVGSRLELLLLDGKLDEAIRFSELVTEAMFELRKSFEQVAGLNISLFGGDDLIAEFCVASLSAIAVNQFRRNFESKCGVTISAGVGTLVEDALANLRRAKLSGKNRLVGDL